MLPIRPVIPSAIATLVILLALPSGSVAAQQTTTTDTTLVTVSGTVYDSLGARPLAGALVQLAMTDLHGSVLSARTDLTGSFHIRAVHPGEYIVGFTHPFLDSLGLERPPMKLTVDGSTPIQLSLAIPSPLTVRAQLCPATQPTDSSGLILGFLRDADSGMHLDSGTVVLEWTEVTVSKNGKSIRPERRSATARASSAGWYALCGIPTAGPIAAHAEIGKDVSGYVDIEVPPRGVLHRDFSIPRGTAAVAMTPTDTGHASETSAVRIRHGRARVAGTVLDRNGKPLHGARLLVWGSDIGASTDDDGRFSLAGLPAGTQTLEARQIGYAPKRVAVDLASDRTASVTMTLDKVADVLDQVTVYGEPSALSRKLAGFRQRMRAGWGRFITRADIEKRAPIRFTDLLRGIPGIEVYPIGAFDYGVRSSRPGGCRPFIYVDGHRLVGPAQTDMDAINDLVWLDYVVGVEVYSTSIYAPPEFGGPRCGGSIVVWTSPDARALARADDRDEP